MFYAGRLSALHLTTAARARSFLYRRLEAIPGSTSDLIRGDLKLNFHRVYQRCADYHGPTSPTYCLPSCLKCWRNGAANPAKMVPNCKLKSLSNRLVSSVFTITHSLRCVVFTPLLSPSNPISSRCLCWDSSVLCVQVLPFPHLRPRWLKIGFDRSI